MIKMLIKNYHGHILFNFNIEIHINSLHILINILIKYTQIILNKNNLFIFYYEFSY